MFIGIKSSSWSKQFDAELAALNWLFEDSYLLTHILYAPDIAEITK